MTQDCRGHGCSDGLFGYIPSFDSLVSQLHEFIQHSKQLPENVKLSHFLIGESMGGAVAIRLLQTFGQEQWKGAVLLSPMCKISAKVAPPQPVIMVLSSSPRKMYAPF